VDALKYQQAPPRPPGGSKEMLTLKLRYKQPEADTSRLLEIPFTDQAKLSAQPSHDFEWSAAIAAFGMLLRDSKHKGNADFDLALELAQGGKGHDELGYRAECIELMKKAKAFRAGR
jgi:Ca-activated chloride channel family protein